MKIGFGTWQRILTNITMSLVMMVVMIMMIVVVIIVTMSFNIVFHIIILIVVVIIIIANIIMLMHCTHVPIRSINTTRLLQFVVLGSGIHCGHGHRGADRIGAIAQQITAAIFKTLLNEYRMCLGLESTSIYYQHTE